MHIYKKIGVGFVSGVIALSYGLVVLAQDQTGTVFPPPTIQSTSEGVNNTATQLSEERKKELEMLRDARQKELEANKEARQKKAENVRESGKKEVEALREARKNEMENLKDVRQNELEKLKKNREVEKEKIKDMRANRPPLDPTNPEMVKNRMEELKKEQEQIREDFKQEAERVREDLKQRREKAVGAVKQKREEVKQKIEQLRDEQKKKMAAQIVEQFDRINKVETNHFLNVLDRDATILLKIGSRADKATTMGKDVSAVNAAIEKAQVAIDVAKAAVTAQALKTYTVDTAGIPNTTASETTTAPSEDQTIKAFRDSFRAVHEQLKNDLKTLRNGVIKDSHESVRAALVELKKIPNIDQDTPPSSAATSTTNTTSDAGGTTQ